MDYLGISNWYFRDRRCADLGSGDVVSVDEIQLNASEREYLSWLFDVRVFALETLEGGRVHRYQADRLDGGGQSIREFRPADMTDAIDGCVAYLNLTPRGERMIRAAVSARAAG